MINGLSNFLTSKNPRGALTLERGYGDVRPWRPPFHASPAARKGPISSKRVSSQDPLLRKFGNKFSLNSLNFHPNFSSQAPQIWKFSAHKPPNLEIFRSQAPLFRGKCQFASPTLRKSGPHTPTWKKKLSAPRVKIMARPFEHKTRNSSKIFCTQQHSHNSAGRGCLSAWWLVYGWVELKSVVEWVVEWVVQWVIRWPVEWVVIFVAIVLVVSVVSMQYSWCIEWSERVVQWVVGIFGSSVAHW